MKKKVVLSVAVVLLLVMVTAMCVACTPNADKIEKKLKENGYTVQVADATDKQTEETGATKGLMANKKEFSLSALMPDLTITWYKDSKSAKKAYEDAKKGLEEAKDLTGTNVYQVKRKGNAVMMGTEEALKLV